MDDELRSEDIFHHSQDHTTQPSSDDLVANHAFDMHDVEDLFCMITDSIVVPESDDLFSLDPHTDEPGTFSHLTLPDTSNFPVLHQPFTPQEIDEFWTSIEPLLVDPSPERHIEAPVEQPVRTEEIQVLYCGS